MEEDQKLKLPKFRAAIQKMKEGGLTIVGDSAINCWGSPETVADARARAQKEVDSYPPERNLIFNGKKLKRSKKSD